MKISQLLIVGLPENNDLAAIEELQPGGVILMGRNAGTPAEVRRLTRRIEAACETPPLIMTDQEGGRVQRLKDGFTLIPPLRELAAQGARQVGLMAMTVAAELRAAGLNCNLAPVCDVPSHENDSVIADRAFSDNPIRAALLAAEYVRGAQTTVLCCAKHFPGHGGVGVDSHKGLPVFAGEREQLDAVHLQPFRAAIAADVGAIMAGHIAVPALDETGDPASLSAPIITGLLREELNFRGLVMTDDLEMGALNQYSVAEISVRAMAAGCDMLMFCHSAEKAAAAVDALNGALESGVLPRARIDDALARVAWAKRKFGVIKEKV